ncbi:MAG TPA: hypothetical protein VMT72_06770, partial [Pseudolabrys sp.]|nr:hypothetical protein [Pseudolabrys sp.]
GPSVSAHAGIVNAIKATSDLLSPRSKIIALAPPFAVLRGTRAYNALCNCAQENGWPHPSPFW